MAFVTINYNEGKTKDLGYKSVTLSYDNKGGLNEKKAFKTGNFVKDWYDMRKFIITSGLINGPVSHSSTIDHFIMDGAPYDSAYLHVIKDIPILKYIDRTKNYWFLSPDLEGIEFFVPENTKPTWEELKVICNDK